MGTKNDHATETRHQGGKAPESGVTGIVFDAGGLIALERNDRRAYALVVSVNAEGGQVIVPATALAQVIRNPARQVTLGRFLLAERTQVIALDSDHARSVGILLARSGTADVVDAHVVVCAQGYGFAVVTSDPFDLRKLDPGLRLIAI